MSQPARRRPGPAPSLSRDQVVDAALEVMAEQGLSAVSFRNVAGRLGVNPMALYTYVRDKDELLAGMFDRVVGDLSLEIDPDSPPVEQLVDYYRAARRVLLKNADLYRLVRPAGLPGTDFHTIERLLALFARLGLGPTEIVRVQLVVLQLTMGSALYAAALDGGKASTTVVATMEHLDAEEYPHLHAVAARLQQVDPEEEFVESVRSILTAAAT